MSKIKIFVIENSRKLKHIIRLSPHDVTTSAGKSSERYRRIILTGGSSAIVKGISAIINLITVPLTVHYLGAERYGLWMAISSTLALMSFADLGLGNGLLNAISKAHGRNSIKEAQIAVSSTFFLLLGISMFLLIIFTSVYPFVNWSKIFNVKSYQAIQESGPTLRILVIILLINMPLGINQRIQNGYQEGYKYQVWLVLGTLLSFLGLLICISLEGGLPWLVFTFSAGQLIATIMNGFYLFNRKRQYLVPRLKYFDFQIGQELIKTGLIFFVLGIFTLLGNASDDIILAHTIGASYIAEYEITKKLFLFSMITQFVIQPLWPAFAEAMESGDYHWAKKTLKKGLLLSMGGSALISLPLLIIGKQIISLWVGSEYVPSWSLLLGFYLFVIMANYGGVMSTFLNSNILVSKQTIMIGLSSICSVCLKIYLSINYGISGIIWATVLSYSVFFVIPSYKLSFKHLNKKLSINHAS